MSEGSHLVWDTCVFARYMIADDANDVRNIEAFMNDVRQGRRTVYYSTVVLAEIGRPLMRSGQSLDVLEFAKTLGSNFVQVDANSNVMATASMIHAAIATNPDPKGTTTRVVGLGDAIHLATALHLQDVLQQEDVTLHTYDRGRGKGWEGRCVPLLGFERWFPEKTRSELISRVCDLPRSEPLYPQVPMALEGGSGVQPNPSRRH